MTNFSQTTQESRASFQVMTISKNKVTTAYYYIGYSKCILEIFCDWFLNGLELMIFKKPCESFIAIAAGLI
jgi:hypothetical protein